METGIASESDARMLNRVQKHFKYSIVYFVVHMYKIASGRVTKWTCWGD